ncbi:MAG: hypothetical protein M1829_000237 [Trizodia sp. TS-e1964]|nr:MAG: hypothetical protein M1829_000237 [Trizodia sp. TS-e1964]
MQYCNLNVRIIGCALALVGLLWVLIFGDVFILAGLNSSLEIQHEKSAIVHIVLFEYTPETTPETIKDVSSRLLGLKGKCFHPQTNNPIIKSARGGRDNSPEGLQEGISHAYVFEFENKEDRDLYLVALPHLEFIKTLEGVVKRAEVIDFAPGVTMHVFLTEPSEISLILSQHNDQCNASSIIKQQYSGKYIIRVDPSSRFGRLTTSLPNFEDSCNIHNIMFRIHKTLDVVTLFHAPKLAASTRVLALLKRASTAGTEAANEDQASAPGEESKLKNIRSNFELEVTENAPTSDQLKTIFRYLGGGHAAIGKVVRGSIGEADAISKIARNPSYFARPVTVDWSTGSVVVGDDESQIIRMLQEPK